jgi:hypothetical protein
MDVNAQVALNVLQLFATPTNVHLTAPLPARVLLMLTPATAQLMRNVNQDSV